MLRSTETPDLTARALFRAWTQITVRYNDLDPLGHVNNAAMAIYLEQARCELIAPKLKAVDRSLDMVLASTTLDYKTELHYPGLVEVGTVATRIGTKSFELAHGVFQDGICAGTGKVVLVVFDLDKRASTAIPTSVRDVLQGLLAEIGE